MMAFLNSVEASGKARADEIVDRIIRNPLVNSNIKAEKILFNIAGGNNLSMIEVEKISRRIADLNPQAKIIFGISKNLKVKNRVKTTLLITGPSSPLPSMIKPEIKPEEKKRIKTKEKAKDLKAVKAPKKEKKKKTLKTSLIKTSIPISGGIKSTQPAAKKEMIRRTALEAKKAQEIEENKRIKQEAEWEIPAFLRRMKLKT